MKTATINTTIGRDGTLRLEVPMGLPAGSAEVVVVVQAHTQVNQRPPQRLSARSGLFPEAPPQELDVDAELNELNQEWQSKLSDLE